MFEVELADRMNGLSLAIFSEMAELAAQAEAKGLDVINLGIGSPDGIPDEHIRAALKDGVDKPEAFGYPCTEGCLEFREAAAFWYNKRFGVELDPKTQVHSLMGSQDGLAHLALGFVNPGDIALIPDPGYPIYSASIALAGGLIYPIRLTEENGFLPDFESIPEGMAVKAKLMLLNYPNNPLTVTADCDFLAKAVAYAKRYNIVLCYDNAYSELAFDGFKPPSIMQVPGASEFCVEFNSLSKAFSMAGARVAYAVGSPEIIKAISIIKSNIDFGVFKPVQAAAAAALTGPSSASVKCRERYERRRNKFIDGLNTAGWPATKPKATMFIWTKIPEGYGSSVEFARDLLDKAGVVVIPGTAFGEMGEGYVRMALVHPDERLDEAVDRITGYLSKR